MTLKFTLGSPSKHNQASDISCCSRSVKLFLSAIAERRSQYMTPRLLQVIDRTVVYDVGGEILLSTGDVRLCGVLMFRKLVRRVEGFVVLKKSGAPKSPLEDAEK